MSEINLNNEIESRFQEKNIWKWKTLDSWTKNIFGKKIEDMNDDERKRVISYIIIKNDKISFRWFLEDLAKDLNVKYNKEFRKALFKEILHKDNYTWNIEERTDLLHKLVFLVKVDNNISLLKEKFGKEKSKIITETQGKLSDEKNSLSIEDKKDETPLINEKEIIQVISPIKEAPKTEEKIVVSPVIKNSNEENKKTESSAPLKTESKETSISPIVIKESKNTDNKDNIKKVEILSELKDDNRDIKKEAEDKLWLSEMKKYIDKSSSKENKVLIKMLENFLKEENIKQSIAELFKSKFLVNYTWDFEQNKRLYTNLYLGKNKFNLIDYIEFLWMNYSDETVNYLWKQIIWNNFSWSELDKLKLLNEMLYLYEFANSDELEELKKWKKKTDEEKFDEAEKKVEKLKKSKLIPPPELVILPKKEVVTEKKVEKKTTLIAPAIKSTYSWPSKCVVTARSNLNNILAVDEATPWYIEPKWNASEIIKKREVIELTKADAKSYMLDVFEKWEANVFEVFVKTKRRHIAVAFIWKDWWVYILDPYFNWGTTKPIPIDEYSAFKRHSHISISTKQDLVSTKKWVAPLAMK